MEIRTAETGYSKELSYPTADIGDYFVLLKPRVMTLVVFTGAMGYLVAPQGLHPLLGLIALFALAIGAGAAGAMNMVYERELDAMMERTRNRPLPKGLMEPSDALGFAIILALASLVLMWLAAGVMAASLLAVSIFFYAVIYTILLKPNTPQNIVIGGASGAFPPVIGWAVATGELSWDAVALFAIIFFWTPPHFWALALFSKNDYAKAGLPMLPNTHGIYATKQHIFAYSLVLFACAIVPYILGTVGEFYLAVAIVFGAIFAFKAWQLLRASDIAPARSVFGFSILYLFMVFGALLVDKYLLMAWEMIR